MTNEEIQKILPQRYPFLLIDKVIDFKKDEKLVAIKNISYNEPFFMGHFPNKPVMPGVLLIEAMAQAGVLFLNLNNTEDVDSVKESDIYFLCAVKARFFKPAVPGDQVRFEVVPVKLTSNSGIVKVSARVGDKEIAKSELTGKREV